MNALACPKCGCENVHPINVEVNPCGKHGGAASIDAAGLHIDKTTTPVGRGVVIRLMFMCESMDVWTLDFQFHKGATTIDITILPDVPMEKWASLRTIWRD